MSDLKFTTAGDLIPKWTVGVTDDGRVYIQDDDFTYDARLYIDGDFSDLESQLAYAMKLAESLNESKKI